MYQPHFNGRGKREEGGGCRLKTTRRKGSSTLANRYMFDSTELNAGESLLRALSEIRARNAEREKARSFVPAIIKLVVRARQEKERPRARARAPPSDRPSRPMKIEIIFKGETKALCASPFPATGTAPLAVITARGTVG